MTTWLRSCVHPPQDFLGLASHVGDDDLPRWARSLDPWASSLASL
jgi:hypothetical protein